MVRLLVSRQKCGHINGSGKSVTIEGASINVRSSVDGRTQPHACSCADVDCVLVGTDTITDARPARRLGRASATGRGTSPGRFPVHATCGQDERCSENDDPCLLCCALHGAFVSLKSTGIRRKRQVYQDPVDWDVETYSKRGRSESLAAMCSFSSASLNQNGVSSCLVKHKNGTHRCLFESRDAPHPGERQ